MASPHHETTKYFSPAAEADFAAVTTAEGPPTPLGQSAAVVSGRYCPDVCSLGFQPVCGSDGQVYGSECKLNVARCRNLTLTKRNEGVCCKCIFVMEGLWEADYLLLLRFRLFSWIADREEVSGCMCMRGPRWLQTEEKVQCSLTTPRVKFHRKVFLHCRNYEQNSQYTINISLFKLIQSAFSFLTYSHALIAASQAKIGPHDKVLAWYKMFTEAQI